MELTEEQLKKLEEMDKPAESVDYDPISLAAGAVGPGALVKGAKAVGSAGKMGMEALQTAAKNRALNRLAQSLAGPAERQASREAVQDSISPLIQRYHAGDKAAADILEQRLANMGAQGEKMHPNVTNIKEAVKPGFTDSNPLKVPVKQEPVGGWEEWARKMGDKKLYEHKMGLGEDVPAPEGEEATAAYEALSNLLKKRQGD